MASAVQRLLQRFALGLNALNCKKKTLVVLILTLAIWLLEFSFMLVVFRMFSLNLPFLAAVVTVVIVSVGLMLRRRPEPLARTNFLPSPVCISITSRRARRWLWAYS